MTKITAEQAEFLKKRKEELDGYARAYCAENCNNCILHDDKCFNLDLINKLLAEYEAQQQEAMMSDHKEIKFKDKTRGGYEYRIYTTEGMDKDFPLVGEIDCGTYYQCATWDINGIADDTSDDTYDLIPIEPAELEGLEVGDSVYVVNMDGIIGRYFIKERNGDDFFSTTGMCMHIDGTHNDIGNGQKLFFRSEERALASIKEK